MSLLEMVGFLSIQAQDFIEEPCKPGAIVVAMLFLSIQAQDFIEESGPSTTAASHRDS